MVFGLHRPATIVAREAPAWRVQRLEVPIFSGVKTGGQLHDCEEDYEYVRHVLVQRRFILLELRLELSACPLVWPTVNKSQLRE